MTVQKAASAGDLFAPVRGARYISIVCGMGRLIARGGDLAYRLLADMDADGQADVLVWPDGGLPEPVSRSPLSWPLDAEALEDLRWYLEDYLRAPYGVWEDRGPAVEGELAGWGDLVFASVFGAGPARDAYQRARDKAMEVLFRSDVPGLLGLPWELMRDGAGPLALGSAEISRSLRVADSAAAAVILAADYGPSLPADVEAALAARHAQRRYNRFIDPISLATLIVSIATLAWTIYNDQRDRSAEPPPPSAIARQVRITLREQEMVLPEGTERITELIATEIIQHGNPDE